VRVAATGDIACPTTSGSFNDGLGTATSCRQQAVADLIAARDVDAVLPLGDTQYDCGQYDQFIGSYDRSWGRFLAITHPTVGNHEYGKGCATSEPDSAAGYFTYFGSRAGPDNQGWYSFDLGAWHLIALNSQCSAGTDDVEVGGCSTGSPQYTWLQQDLAAHPNPCTLAYWHKPRWTSGEHSNAVEMTDIWNLLVTRRVELVLSGHNHSYERFDPLGTATTDGSPVPDPDGVREIVVGTGGKNHYPFTRPALTGEVVRNGDTFGALILTLRDGSYAWEFAPEPGKTFTDAGSATCQ
jgi:hypothetical protein